MFVVLLGVFICLAIIWLFVCIIILMDALCEGNTDKVIIWSVSTVFTAIALTVAGVSEAELTLRDEQRKPLCEEQEGTWQLSKCYKDGKEIDL